jgi:hypothetical protein
MRDDGTNNGYFQKVAAFLKMQDILDVSITPETRLEHDLGITGDDAVPLMEAFCKEFDVVCEHFPAERYFSGEGIRIPFLTAFLFRLINGRPIPPPPARDLTVADLVRTAELKEWRDPD